MCKKESWKQEYVESRKDMIYYKYVRSLISICSINAKSMLDVGSGAVDLLSHCSNVTEKYSLDLRHPLEADGVVGIKEDFLKWESNKKFDIVCCFQVLEHIQDVESFCQKLLQLATYEIIVSVPYMWEKGKSKFHVQDPVDVDKLVGWFGFEPTFCNIVDGRLIAVFLKNADIRDNLFEQNEGDFADFYKDYLLTAADTEHRVPFELLGKGKKIVLYGAGERGQKYYEQLNVRSDYELVLWIDKNYEKFENSKCKISAPDDIRKKEYDVVLIAVKDYEVAKNMKDNAIALGVDEEKLVWVK